MRSPSPLAEGIGVRGWQRQAGCHGASLSPEPDSRRLIRQLCSGLSGSKRRRMNVTIHLKIAQKIL